jgi:endoglucanase
MKLHSSFLIFVLFFSASITRSQTNGFLKAEGQRIVDGNGKIILLRGIGLGGWMLQEGYMLRLNHDGQQFRIRQRIDSLLTKEQTREFYNLWLANHTSKSDIDSLHAWGFNSVRLPMHYKLYTLSVDEEPVAGENTWLTTGFALTDSLVAWCKANGMYVILDLHAAPGGQGNDLNISDRDPAKPSLWQSVENRNKTISLWRKLAERYANESTIAGYDILNEPNWGFEDTLKDRNGLNEQKNIQLKQLLEDITTAIRQVDKNHIIIIEGNGWGNNYRGMLPTWDKNMVLSFHKYWNENNLRSIQYILNYREQYNVPVWLGETGENSNTWFTEAIRLLESNNIGWAWWPLKKLGNNNPLQIPSNPEYDALVNYWNGKSAHPPSSEDVYMGLMELAKDARFENNIIHRDVIDAMIRQPFSDAAIPYKQNRISSGTILSAADYDLGVNGSAYFDRDTANYRISTGKESTGNRGHVYRNDGVDIFADSTLKGSFYVGHIEDGEWMQYTIDVEEPGKYKLLFSVSSENGNGIIALSEAGNSAGGQKNIQIPATGGNLNWQDVSLNDITFNKGIHQLRILAISGGFNLRSITFLK